MVYQQLARLAFIHSVQPTLRHQMVTNLLGEGHSHLLGSVIESTTVTVVKAVVVLSVVKNATFRVKQISLCVERNCTSNRFL